MHRDLVDRRKWIGEKRFLHALNFCTLLPGPEAQQLSIYIGWMLHGIRGGIVAGVLFILPGAVLMGLLSWLHAAHGHLPAIGAVLGGLRPAVIAIVIGALWRIGSRALHGPRERMIAAGAFLALAMFQVPFPVVVLLAAFIGWWGSAPGRDRPGAGAERPSLRRFAGTVASWLAIWWVPLFAIRIWRGAEDVLWREAVFFSQAACVTFGGAYAVLAHVNDAAVHTFGWLEPGAMLDGLGLAETTPGPLILVTEFVGFHGGWRHPGDLAPVVAGSLGAIVTLWATFAPCFLWIFAAAPYIERLRSHRRLAGALASVTAAVVGVIATLALTLTRSAWWPAGNLDPFTVGLSLAAGWALLKWRWNMPLVIALAVGAGWGRHLLR